MKFAFIRFLLISSVLCATAHAADTVCGKMGGTLTYTYDPEPVTLTTLQTTGVPVTIIAPKIYEGLLDYDGPHMAPAPGLAQSWDVSADGKIYTFHLRHDVLWQDGKPFTSADVKFSVLDLAKPFHSRGMVYYGKLASVDTPDPYTVVFTLQSPVPYFLQAFQATETPMMPAHAFTAADVATKAAFLKSPIMAHPMGTGPFELKQWDKGSDIILTKNPHYWQKGLPCLDQVILKVIPDASARALAVESGEVDLAPMNSVPDAEIDHLATQKDLVVTEKGVEGLGTDMWLDVNLRNKPLSDQRVRQAISLALDRNAIVNVIWYGHGKPARGPLVSTNPFYDAALPAYPYDLKKANEILDQAGYTKKDGVRFTIVQNFLPYGEKYQRLAEYIRVQLGKIGINAQTQSVDFGGWLQRVFTDWSYQMTSTFTDNRTDPSIGTERLFSSAYIKRGATFTNSMGYDNPRIDAIFNQAQTETDPKKRQALFNEMQVILHNELPVIFLMELPSITVYNRRVHNLITNGTSYYGNWATVWKN